MSLQINFEPEAVQDAATWQVQGNNQPIRFHGEIADLPPGDYVIEFHPVETFAPPAPLSIRLEAGQTLVEKVVTHSAARNLLFIEENSPTGTVVGTVELDSATPPEATSITVINPLPTFSQLPPLTTTGIATGTVTADLDLNGRPDLLVSDNTRNQIFLSDASGAFTSLEGVDLLPAAAQFIHTVDMDRNGRIDVVLATTSSVRLYLNEQPRPSTPDGDTPPLSLRFSQELTPPDDGIRSLLSGDFDNNGTPDIVIASPSTVRIYDTPESGILEPTGRDVATPFTNIQALAVGDLNQDGKIDLVLGRNGLNQILLNAGNGTFPEVSSVSSEENDTRIIQVRDIDGNGHADIIHVDSSGIAVNYNGREGIAEASELIAGPSMPVQAIEVVDINNDATADFIYQTSDSVEILLGNTDGTFLPMLLESCTVAGPGLIATDLNLDGRIDFGIVEQNGLCLALQDRIDIPAFTLSPATGRLSVLNDALLDYEAFVAQGLAPTITIAYAHRPVPTFELDSEFRLPDAEGFDDQGIALGDFNSDGTIDAVTHSHSGIAQIWTNDGLGNFEPGQDLTLESPTELTSMPFPLETPAIVIQADIDTDGDLDLLTSHREQGIGVWLNDKTGFFKQAQIVEQFQGVREIETGDFDNDGDVDFFIADDKSENSTFLVNNGSGLLESDPALPTFGSAIAAELIDQDQDGDLDLWLATSALRFQLYLNNGRGNFISNPEFDRISESTIHELVAEDFTGDGRPDLFLAMESGFELWRFQGLGEPMIRIQSQEQSGIARGAISRDLDQDGDPDILLIKLIGQGQLWLNNGTGLFENSGLTLGNRSSTRFDVADFDGDGDLDLWNASFSGMEGILLSNQSELKPQYQSQSVVITDVNELPPKVNPRFTRESVRVPNAFSDSSASNVPANPIPPADPAPPAGDDGSTPPPTAIGPSHTLVRTISGQEPLTLQWFFGDLTRAPQQVINISLPQIATNIVTTNVFQIDAINFESAGIYSLVLHNEEGRASSHTSLSVWNDFEYVDNLVPGFNLVGNPYPNEAVIDIDHPTNPNASLSFASWNPSLQQLTPLSLVTVGSHTNLLPPGFAGMYFNPTADTFRFRVKQQEGAKPLQGEPQVHRGGAFELHSFPTGANQAARLAQIRRPFGFGVTELYILPDDFSFDAFPIGTPTYNRFYFENGNWQPTDPPLAVGQGYFIRSISPSIDPRLRSNTDPSQILQHLIASTQDLPEAFQPEFVLHGSFSGPLPTDSTPLASASPPFPSQPGEIVQITTKQTPANHPSVWQIRTPTGRPSGLGTGTFERDNRRYEFPETSASVVLGDFNGDAVLDAWAPHSTGSQLVPLGPDLGDESTIAPIDYHHPAATNVALGDLDGDGDLDIWINNPASNEIEGPEFDFTDQVWINPGNGKLRTRPQSSKLPNSLRVELADLDGDGDLDAWTLNTEQESSIWFNDGQGDFLASSETANADLARRFAPLLLGTDQTEAPENSNKAVSSLLSIESNDLALGDLDGDGDIDAWITGRIDFEINSDFFINLLSNRILLNDGNGQFVLKDQTNEAAAADHVALGDIDADGDLDAVLTSTSRGTELRVNDGQSQFSATEQTFAVAFKSALGDLNGDGYLDLCLLKDETCEIWFNRSTDPGTFTQSQQSLQTTALKDIALGDLDRDGDIDIFLLTASGQSEIWWNQNQNGQQPRSTRQLSLRVEYRFPDSIQITWPASDAILEAAKDPMGPWEPVAEPVTRTNATHTLVTSITQDRRFFRLQNPRPDTRAETDR